MNALAKQPDAPAAPVALTDSNAMMAIIERAARDPNIDIDKMERLMAMKERMDASRAKSAFDSALAEMQPKLPVVHKNGKIITTFVYPPISIRSCDWQAHFDGDEPNDEGQMLVGIGATEQEAINDLLDAVEE
ncbi:hypothetical protein UFOVP1623_13 [uncultured Caudovirales phage]|uniref:Uncharacterized protein n=1 Tax=uncultured Caudovirales phage TaxID=2100421 RepID=A0A6J5RZX2_9CAUD|nr:hypothetical protein UFOVP1376_50 [uncultured Caudovirales phage]CAB4220665.1 hypothetical protein UFOVP1623_13 [uncultured Caudovirales phage]